MNFLQETVTLQLCLITTLGLTSTDMLNNLETSYLSSKLTKELVSKLLSMAVLSEFKIIS